MLGQKLSAGVQVDLYSTRQAGDYQNTNEITFEGGLLYRPVSALSIGLHFYNPFRAQLGIMTPPAEVTLGQVIISLLHSWQSLNLKAVIRDIIQFVPGSNTRSSIMCSSGGLLSNPFGFSFGAGYKGRILQADIGFITHENLGPTPSLSLILFLK
ncbi:MAG: hypothetical protein R2744_12880 [Bacteroidales bacterium]